MLVYWDSSALLNALAAQTVLNRLDQGQHITRSHGYVEAFHHLSGRGLLLRDHQNRLFATMPNMLNGPWSSKPSVALSSFCNVSFALR